MDRKQPVKAKVSTATRVTAALFVVLLAASAALSGWLFLAGEGPEGPPAVDDRLRRGAQVRRAVREAPFVLPGGKPTGYNVVLFPVDALRGDHLSCYGYPRRTSPHIDAQAEGAIVFENHKSQSSHTLISMTALFSSRHTTDAGLVRLNP